MTGANNIPPYFNSPPRERDLGQEHIPLVSEIDDFSRGYNDAIGATLGLGLLNNDGRDRERDRSRSNIPTTVANPLGSYPSIPNLRTQDSSQGRENVRGDGGWSPQQLRMNYSSNFSGGNRNGEEEIDIPPRSPLRDSMSGMVTNIAAATVAAAAGVGAGMGRGFGAGERERDNRPRYQLVDDGVPDDAPVLHSPGRLRGLGHQRGQSSAGKDGM
jgi:hypothetical protein